MTAWIFVLMLFLPSFGGEVRATIRTADQASCERLRRVVLQQFGGEQNMNGMVTPCAPEDTP